MTTHNRLASESSLYLRQHAANPVDWYPWGPEALAAATTADQPIFLSIGYSACHWCHVMEHESFEDAATAAVMNAHFVCIKVDREERPDLDAIYMTALQLLTREGGGWPLSVFLTPQGTPFYAGTYFPPKDAYGRPSFRRILTAVAESWTTKREQLNEVGARVAEALQDYQTQTAGDGELNEGLLKIALTALQRNYDAVHGGFGHAPKFPHPIDLRLLLKLGQRFEDASAFEMVQATLQKMARGGIYDQVGGGFARYSVDAHWLVPHFEKMLYDNALLVPVYLEAWQHTGDVFYKQIATETLDWVLKEMTCPGGGFYSTLDADSEGEEGKFYVWSDVELDTVLGDDAAFAKRVWGVTPGGNFEGHNILFRQRSDAEDAALLGMTLEAFHEQLQAIKAKLYAVRAKRVWPGRDEKILTAWNALMIAAFAKAGTVLNEPKYIAAAQAATRFVLERLRTVNGRLLRTCGVEQPAKLNGYLEDYAYLADALITLYEADFDAKWIAIAGELADAMLLHFTAPDGGFFTTAADHETLIVRMKDWHDGSTPSGNAMAATVLLKLAILCDRPDFKTAAEATLDAFKGAMADNPAAVAQMLTAFDFVLGPTREVVIVGSANDPDTKTILQAVRRSYHARQLIVFHDPANGSSTVALLRNRAGDPRGVTTYFCSNGVCQAPVLGHAAVGRSMRKPFDPERGAIVLAPLGTIAIVAGIALMNVWSLRLGLVGIALLLLACVSRTEGFLFAGPFVGYELRRTVRRTRLHLWWGLLAGFAAIGILIGYGIVTFENYPRDKVAGVATYILLFITWNLFLIMVSVVVTLLAYSIAEDRDGKRLDFLLASDLRSREIVLGKALGRTLAGLSYAAVLLPFLILLPALFSIDPDLMLLVFVIIGVSMFSLAGLSLLSSALAATKKTGGTVLTVFVAPYMLLSFAADFLKTYPQIWFFPGSPVNPTPVMLGDVLELIGVGNPIIIFKGWMSSFAGGVNLTAMARDLPGYAAFHVGFGLLGLMLAAWLLRSKSATMADKKLADAVETKPVPPVQDRPIVWKERYFTKAVVQTRRKKAWKLASFLMIGFPFLVFVAAAVSDLNGYAHSIRELSAVYPPLLCWIFSVAGSRFGLETIVRERDKDTLTSLLLSDCTPREIITEKFIGIIRIMVPSWFAVAAVTAGSVLCGGLPWWCGGGLVVMLCVFSVFFILIGLHTSARATSLEAASKVFAWKLAPLAIVPPLCMVSVIIAKQANADQIVYVALIIGGILFAYSLGGWLFWRSAVRRFEAACNPAAEDGPLLSKSDKPA